MFASSDLTDLQRTIIPSLLMFAMSLSIPTCFAFAQTGANIAGGAGLGAEDLFYISLDWYSQPSSNETDTDVCGDDDFVDLQDLLAVLGECPPSSTDVVVFAEDFEGPAGPVPSTFNYVDGTRGGTGIVSIDGSGNLSIRDGGFWHGWVGTQGAAGPFDRVDIEGRVLRVTWDIASIPCDFAPFGITRVGNFGTTESGSFHGGDGLTAFVRADNQTIRFENNFGGVGSLPYDLTGGVIVQIECGSTTGALFKVSTDGGNTFTIGVDTRRESFANADVSFDVSCVFGSPDCPIKVDRVEVAYVEASP